MTSIKALTGMTCCLCSSLKTTFVRQGACNQFSLILIGELALKCQLLLLERQFEPGN